MYSAIFYNTLIFLFYFQPNNKNGRKILNEVLSPKQAKKTLMRIDSSFESTTNHDCKEFESRFARMFKAPESIPPPESFAESIKTYPSRKIRLSDDNCNKG